MDAVLEWLESRFAENRPKGVAKYQHLSHVIVSGIREGILGPGAKLPPEQVLSEKLSVSLATVRKCFTHLAQSGVISREHGRGTFVSKEEYGKSDLWHFRFRDSETGDFMPIYNRIMWRGFKKVPEVAGYLGSDPARLVFIERAVNIGTCFVCYSHLFLPGEKFGRIMDEPLAELERVNIKDVLAFEFRSPTLRVDQLFRIDRLDARAAEVMGLERGAPALLLSATGYTFEDQPISHQKIWIPETEYELDMPASLQDMAGASRVRVPSLSVVNEG